MSQYQRITLRPGVVINARTAAMLADAERRLGKRLVVVQGSYHPGVSASGGTHDGGGVVDLAPAVRDVAVRDLLSTLRKVGFAAWLRTPAQGPWGLHIHAVAIGDREMSRPAHTQVVDYLAGRNGLANRGKDDGPRVRIRPWDLVRRIVRVRLAQRELDRWRREHA